MINVVSWVLDEMDSFPGSVIDNVTAVGQVNLNYRFQRQYVISIFF